MAVVTQYGMVYGTPSEVISPLGKDRSHLLEPGTKGVELIPRDQNLIQCVREYIRAYEFDTRRSALFVPRVLGVLEVKTVIGDQRESFEAELQDAIRRNESAQRFGYQCAGLVMSPVLDSFEPNLIHIGYDSGTGLNKSLVNQAFGGRIPTRVVVSSIDSLPCFYDKTPDSALQLCERFSELVREGKNPGEIRRIIDSEVLEVKEEIETFGATSVQYNIFAPIKHVHALCAGI